MSESDQRERPRQGAGGRAEALAERMRGVGEGLGGLVTRAASRAASRAGKGADRLREAAQGLRRSPAFQHAMAARERGNLEAAFWLLHEEWSEHPDDPELAAAYWDAAVALDRIGVAAPAGVALVQQRAAAGELESAAQYWTELVSAVPDALVPPPALARILPELRRRVDAVGEDERNAARTLVRRAMRHAVDPRNETPSAGVALRLFEEGREANPEAARRAAQVALDSPDLHEAKRKRLRAWLDGGELEAPPAPPPTPEAAATPEAPPTTEVEAAPEAEAAPAAPAQPAPERSAPPARKARQAAAPRAAKPAGKGKPEDGVAKAADPAEPAGDAKPADTGKAAGAARRDRRDALSEDEIAAAAARLPLPSPAPLVPAEAVEALDDEDALETVDDADPELEIDAEALASTAPADPPPALVPDAGGDTKVLVGVPLALTDDALTLRTEGGGETRVAWKKVEAVSAVEVAGVAVIDLVLNWSRHGREPLRAVRLRGDAFDATSLVSGASDPAVALPALLAEILDRTRAVPLPDPESALGLRLATFDDLDAYERAVLRSGG